MSRRTPFTAGHRAGAGPPLVLLHGFTDTWRTWELVLPALERRHEVLAPTLAGHAGGPPLPDPPDDDSLADAVERAMDEAGMDLAHIAGNSLGGHVALQLAARGRALTVTALAPAGGWAEGDRSHRATLDHFSELRAPLRHVAPTIRRRLSMPDGRRRATAMIVEDDARMSDDLIAHQVVGAAACPGAEALIARARTHGWPVDTSRIACPVRVVWGTADRLLPWPGAAAGFRGRRLTHADWVELDGVGHCPHLEAPEVVADLILGFTGA
ncbi:MAG: alpha/beta fold hydrolase [Miltoncostaeaceae bacterium]